MIDVTQLIWIGAGAGIILLIEALGWFYWRIWGKPSIREYVSEEEEPDGEYQIIKRVKTPTQRIALVKHQDELLIYSNGDVMFGTTEDDEIYAEALIHVPMAAAGKRESILIIGGGGGITTREALKYPEVNKITTVDIDEIMMDFGKNLEPLVKFNKGSLNHPKVKTVIEDGRKFVEENHEKWDAIFIDIPEPSGECPELSRLFSLEFFKLLKERLEPDGVVNISCPSLAYIPDYLWSVHATLTAAGFHVLPYHFDVISEYEDDYGFCMATNRPIFPDEITIRIPTRYLSKARVQDMFYIPYNYNKYWSNNKIQTDSNLALAEIVDDWDD
ncbi:spermine/spermidine synthase [Bacillus oleivorans]|uniref:Polyamine aminopropyltransferase n=1 Tax=Bacillus oleivorans TaxID=1448271 RepID=A0A285CIA5_9BACI|nr:spermidine synthase [Bacillus oleivorans]SNX66748.1 spermine/spermidine synthase [Bacillus oleivorans]